MATYVIGDIHGELEQLKTLLRKMNFGERDELYIMGDVVDRGPNPVKALQFLMTLPNCTCIMGNHELMALANLKLLLHEVTDAFLAELSREDMGQLLDWMKNGGDTTISEFTKLTMEERKEVLEFIRNFEPYVELEIDGQEYLLVHAGLDHFSEEKPMREYDIHDLVWMRTDYEIPYFPDKIVITGHTPTQYILGNPRPGYIYRANHHIAMDCGACSEKGRLAGICLETGEELYAK